MCARVESAIYAPELIPAALRPLPDYYTSFLISLKLVFLLGERRLRRSRVAFSVMVQQLLRGGSRLATITLTDPFDRREAGSRV